MMGCNWEVGGLYMLGFGLSLGIGLDLGCLFDTSCTCLAFSGLVHHVSFSIMETSVLHIHRVSVREAMKHNTAGCVIQVLIVSPSTWDSY
jgi:hypothetical protein